jgi:hypothetical protein
MHQLKAILLVIVFALSMMVTARADTSTEAVRVILLFVVNPPDDNAKKGVISWIQSFKNNLRYLTADFSSGGPDAGPIIKVLLSSKNVDDVDPDVLKDSFESKSSLQVLSTVSRYTGEATVVDNDIYLGDFKGSLAVPYVYISREIKPSLYAVTREALAVVTLYAYAMAIAKTSPNDGNRYLVCKVLDRANMYKDRDLGTDVRTYLEDLFRAISAELELRACGGKK